MKTFIYLSLFSLLVFSAACSGSETKLVASGAFEATEVIVSSESTGKILELSLEEGQEVAAGQVVGRIECLPLNPQNLDLQIKRCQVAAPVGGTVMVKYAQLGEFAATGKALFKLADTRNMLLRAYISADQLTHMQLGQAVKVQADFGAEGFRQYPGTISWISSKAEFTPKTIQTRDERANLVYAMKVSVQNDGYLKSGMYGVIPQETP